MLEVLLRTLSERQRVVVTLRFDHDLTQSQIAAIVGISQMHVSRAIREGLMRMRALDSARPRRREPPSEYPSSDRVRASICAATALACVAASPHRFYAVVGVADARGGTLDSAYRLEFQRVGRR